MLFGLALTFSAEYANLLNASTAFLLSMIQLKMKIFLNELHIQTGEE